MSNAVKCEICGQFEEGFGYSVRIYKHEVSTDPSNGKTREYARRIVTRDHICSSCADAVAKAMNSDIYGGE